MRRSVIGMGSREARYFIRILLLASIYYPGVFTGYGRSESQVQDERRRAARAAYKERKAAAGVYAVRCAPSGEVWVGQTRDLEKIWNRIAFSLRAGGSPNRALQAAWNAHGDAAFAFEALERLEEEALDFARQSALNERAAFWRERLGAAAI